MTITSARIMHRKVPALEKALCAPFSLLTKWLLSKGIEATFYYWIIMAGIIVAVFI
jgi:hypothetical protein